MADKSSTMKSSSVAKSSANSFAASADVKYDSVSDFLYLIRQS